MGRARYILGTSDREVERLAVQHQVWRESTLAFWRRGGIRSGMLALDVGAGPGHAALDLAEIVGQSGRVVALERSAHFTGALKTAAQNRGFKNIHIVETDLLEYDWPAGAADFAWCRWVLAFVESPAKVLAGIANALKSGGRLLIQEYYDYASWRLAPPCPKFQEYVDRIVVHWRDAGGESDIGVALPRLLPEAGLIIDSVQPIVFSPFMNEFAARWPMEFARQHLPNLRASGYLSDSDAIEICAVLDRYEADPSALVISPGVLQIIARKL